ncbi:MAG: hypothetical protein GX359_12545 [Clostridiales bacterium]|nr:hypothetical protein [Clostridiales bacterium]
MMIMTNRSPANWRELQELTAYYFNYSGYDAITPCKIETVRGNVEVDVYVRAEKELGENIICECKFWDTPIPQEKIHAFRTVINDSGASLGIIISKVGFQKGAYSSANNSNIKLLTWEEFLELLFEKWFKFREKRLLKIVQPLAVYTDFMDVPTEEFNEEQTKQYKNSLTKYAPIYIISCSIKEDSIRKYNEIYNESIASYEDFFDDIEERAKEAILFYKDFFTDFEIPDDKFNFNMESISRIIN